MSQITINIGAAANDGTGDPLRTAFNDVNLNFDEVYAAGPVGSNIQIVDNRILTLNTNGNLVLSPNGIGKVVANVDIVPNLSNVRSLGSPTLRWDTVYTKYFNLAGDLTVGGNLIVTGDVIQIGNIITDAKTIQLANTAATDAQANGSGITVGANDDIATLLYNSDNNEWRTNIGANVAGNITGQYFIGNGSQLTGLPEQYGNANVALYLNSGVAGNIIPSANLTYSLGNSTNWWSNIWVASNTIYIGGVALGITGNTLTVAGEPVLSNDSADSITTTGNITAGNIISDGEIISNGRAYVRYLDIRGGQPSGTIGSLGYSGNIPELYGTAGIKITTGDGEGGPQWEFDTSGTLTAPGNITATGNITADYFIGNGSQLTGITGVTGDITFDATTISAPAEEVITVQAINVDSQVTSTVELDPNTGSTTLTAIGGSNSVLFGTGDWSTATWTNNGFGSGVIQIVNAPDIITFLDSALNNAVNITIAINGGEPIPYTGAGYGGGNINLNTGTVLPDPDPTTVTSLEFAYAYQSEVAIDYDNGDISILGRGIGIQIQSTDNDINIDAGDDLRLYSNDLFRLYNRSTTSSIEIITDDNNNSYTWEFGADGTLTAPGDITTAGDITGTAAASTLYLKAQPNSNTSIQLNNTVDSDINTAANLKIRTDSGNTPYVWNFANTGELTAPGNIITTGNITGNFILADLQVIATGDVTGSNIVGISSVQTANVYATNEVSATGNVIGGNLTTAGQVAATGNITASANINAAGGTFTGNVTAGNILTDGYFYANGDPFVSSDYGDSNVVSLLSSFGSNTISTTGNVTAGTFIGNIEITGNVTGTSANVDLIANTYQWSFDNTGNLTLPGNTFAVNYANGTAVTLGGGGATYTAGTGIDITSDVISVDANVVLTSGSQNIETTGNITAGNLIGTIATASQTNITAVGTLDSLSVTGNVTGGNLITAGVAEITGNATIGNITTTNITGTAANVTVTANAYVWTFDNSGALTVPAMGGDEGGEIRFGLASANTTLENRVTVDVYQDRFRVFEGSADAKGAYIDLAQAANGASTLLNNRVSAYVNAGTYVTMDNLKATVSTSGNRSLQIATVTGSFSAYVNASYAVFSGGTGGTGASLTVTTTPALAINWNFTGQGDTATYIINDATNSRCYRVTMMIGGSYNNNFISIERLI